MLRAVILGAVLYRLVMAFAFERCSRHRFKLISALIVAVAYRRLKAAGRPRSKRIGETKGHFQCES